MEKLWAPWRIVYIERGDLNSEQCFLCEKQKTHDMDSENLVLYRGKYSYVLLNAFPYNNGHLMIAPYRHIGEFESLSDDELLEMMILSRLAVSAMRQGMEAQGFNIGINIGCVAGAGRADHIHMHIVPRWGGDTNFMPVLSNTKVLSEALDKTYERLLPYFREQIPTK